MRKLGVQRSLVAGVLLLLPLWLTYLVVRFVFETLAGVTEPLVSQVVDWPDWARYPISALLTVGLLYLTGLLGTWVLGRQIVRLIDRLMERLPLVKTVYGGLRRLLEVLRASPERERQQVVLIEPAPGHKSVGLVTRVLTDTTTGEDYAAVYVPTTPNPTSGLFHLVPVDQVSPADMTMDEAMTFIISGGVVSPPRYVEKRAEEPTAGPRPEPAA